MPTATPLAELNAMFPNVNQFDVPGDSAEEFSKYFLNLLADFSFKDAPLTPEAARIFRGRRGTDPDPGARCLPAGVPAADFVPAPIKFIQTPGLTIIADEAGDPVRQVYTDGRKHTADPTPSFMGYSVGKWDADAFVINTVGFNDKTWLDIIGHPHSESMKVEERFRRRDFGHMDVALTVDDPVMYTRPFTVKFTMDLVPDSDIIEWVCLENEKDLAHMAGK